MKISIRGAQDRKFGNVLRSAVRCFAEHLFHVRMLPYLRFNIVMLAKLDAGGYCIAYDQHRPREFEIELFKSKIRINLLRTLAHEMVHAKQMAYGQLRDVYRNRRMRVEWMGQDHSDSPYWDQPWEIEAYGLENGLTAKYLAKYNKFAYFRTKDTDWFMADSGELR